MRSGRPSELTLSRPASLDEALAGLAQGGRALAGGTELVPLLREGLVEPGPLVDIGAVVPCGIVGPAIGAATTLAELERSDAVPAVLREACRLSGSLQLRNAGTIAGNLLQEPRCLYWRLGYACYLRGGERCHAREGEHRAHAVLAARPCASAHPSDPAAALVALGALLRTDRRILPIAELYRLPTDGDRRLTTLEPGELILSVDAPKPDASTYLKATDRRAFGFPQVGVAAARFDGEVRLGLAGVAPVPWTLDSPAELDAATPLPGSAWKLDVARALVRRALAAVGFSGTEYS